MNYWQQPQPYYNNQYMQNTQSIQQPQVGLNGKIVDGEDVVRATEVPIGGYGIFPKADLSEIYIKTWNNNGTISIMKYVPKVEEKNTDLTLEGLLKRIEVLENRLEEKKDYKGEF